MLLVVNSYLENCWRVLGALGNQNCPPLPYFVWVVSVRTAAGLYNALREAKTLACDEAVLRIKFNFADRLSF